MARQSGSTGPKERYRLAAAQPDDLLPCRMCGSPPELWQRWIRDDVWCSFGCCTNLEDVDGEACVFHLPDSPHFYRDRKKDAVAYWNLMMGPRPASTSPLSSDDTARLLGAERAFAVKLPSDLFCMRAAPGMVSQRCAYCHGNDGTAPCAYAGEGKPGCLRDARLEYIRGVIERHRLGQRNDYNDVHALIGEYDRLTQVFQEACNEVRTSHGTPCYCKYCHVKDESA